MKIEKYLFLILFLIGIVSCGEKEALVVSEGDFVGFVMTKIEGSDASLAERRDAGGTLLESGIVVNNAKNGIWNTYYTDEGKQLKTSTSFVNGKKSGPDIMFSNRGQIESLTNYINDVLHGMKATYKFGRPVITTEYKNGEFHGQHIEYLNSGKIQKLMEFKNGKQDGLLRYYDEEGKITLEYMYKDGEKVSGGLIE